MSEEKRHSLPKVLRKHLKETDISAETKEKVKGLLCVHCLPKIDDIIEAAILENQKNANT